MKSRLLRFGVGRAVYVFIVSVALVVTAVRTFVPGGRPDSSAATDSTQAGIDTASTTNSSSTVAPGSVPVSTVSGARPTNGSVATPRVAATTIPHTGTTFTVPSLQAAATVPAQQTSATTSIAHNTTTAVPTTSTTIYRPGSIVMVIPAGTQARINRGEDVTDVLPLTVNIKVGQYIYLVNKDNYFYTYGPLNVMPLDTTPFFFSVPGTETGYCSISKTTITFNVTN